MGNVLTADRKSYIRITKQKYPLLKNNNKQCILMGSYEY